MSDTPVQHLLDLPDYPARSLANEDVRTVYVHGELRMRAYHDRLLEQGVELEQRARTMVSTRSALRTWTRTLMNDVEAAERLAADERNPTFEDLTSKWEAAGLDRRQALERIIISSTKSRPSINERFGIDPQTPPPLPPRSP